MKYFTYDLIAAANDWIEQTEEARRGAERQFERAVERYHRSLLKLRNGVSGQAWKFFDSGYGHFGLHDGRLISLCVGDGLNYRTDGTSPFRLNNARALARISFLNYEQDLLYTFELRGLQFVRTNLEKSEEMRNSCIGDLFTYELIAADPNLLQLGFLFTSGSSITAKFKQLIFRRQRIKRKYSISAIYL